MNTTITARGDNIGGTARQLAALRDMSEPHQEIVAIIDAEVKHRIQHHEDL